MGIYEPIETGSRSQRTFTFAARVLGALKLDGPLLIGLGLITVYGFVILYSASGQSWNRVADAAVRAALGGFAMCALAQVKPAFLRRLALPLWIVGMLLLVAVDAMGHIGKGAQRWLDLGFIRFQPSEIMKLAVPILRIPGDKFDALYLLGHSRLQVCLRSISKLRGRKNSDH